MPANKRFWTLPPVPEIVNTVIIRNWEPLTENEIDQAFKGSENTQWWKSIVQLIDDARADYISAAAQNAATNNPLGMAREIGAHEALSNLLTVLEKKVEGD